MLNDFISLHIYRKCKCNKFALKKKKKSRLLSEMRRTGERDAESRNNSIQQDNTNRKPK